MKNETIDLPHGVFVLYIQLQDGVIYSDGKVTVDKSVTQYFINKEGEVNLVDSWDFL